MRNNISRKYEGENFAAEKTIATLYIAALVLIVGSGLYAQLSAADSKLTRSAFSTFESR